MITGHDVEHNQPDPSVVKESESAQTGRAIEQLTLATALQGLGDRIASIDSKLAALKTAPSSSHPVLEFMRIALGGWPAFGLLFLLLFYAPLRAALTAIPAKIQSASEIALAGVTLKATITQVAASQGVEGIGKAIPQLSNAALQLLLRAPREGEGLISYTMGANQTVINFNFPSDDAIGALAELKDAGFLELTGGTDASLLEPLDSLGIKRLLSAIEAKFPGRFRSEAHEWRNEWVLDTPADDRATKPSLMWRLTDTGSAAVKVVITAVSAELARTRQAPEKGP